MVGGWTEPRSTRSALRRAAAWRLRRSAPAPLVYVGHTGTGLRSEGARSRLEAAEAARDAESPFASASRPTSRRTGCGRNSSRRCGSRSGPRIGSCVIRCISDCGTTSVPGGGPRDGLRSAARSPSRRDTVGPSASERPSAADDAQGSPAHRVRTKCPERSRPAESHPSSHSCGLSRTRARTARSSCPTGERLGVTNSGQGVLARTEADQGGSAPLLRAGLAADPAGRRRSSAGDEALPERHRQAGVLPAALAHGAAAAGRPHRDARRRPRSDLRAGRAPLRRRQPDHAALHDADRGDLAGPVVLARAVAARRRLRRARSRSRRGDAVQHACVDVARWVRDELRVAARAGVPEDLRLARAARLHPAAARHVVRIGRCCSARSSRRSSPRAIRRSRRSNGWCAPGRAAPSTSTTCRTSSARHWRPPTARAPASSPACRRRSRWEELDEPFDPRDFTIATAPGTLRDAGRSVGAAANGQARGRSRRCSRSMRRT